MLAEAVEEAERRLWPLWRRRHIPVPAFERLVRASGSLREAEVQFARNGRGDYDVGVEYARSAWSDLNAVVVEHGKALPRGVTARIEDALVRVTVIVWNATEA